MNPDTEVINKRTIFSKTYDNGNNNFTLVKGLDPIHYLEDGEHKNIDLTFEVNSIEIMESGLKRGGPEYTILESAVLND